MLEPFYQKGLSQVPAVHPSLPAITASLPHFVCVGTNPVTCFLESSPSEENGLGQASTFEGES